MTLRRLKPSEPLDGAISASTWNSFCDLAVRSQDRLGGPHSPLSGSPVVVQAKNDTGSHLAANQVIGLVDPIIPVGSNLEAFKQSIGFNARIPTAADSDRFAITAAAIPNGQIGPAILAGVVPVQIEVSQAWHRGAKAIVGDRTKLRSASGGGARVLWVESGTGTKWALIQFPFESPFKILYASTDCEHSASATFALAEGPNIQGVFTASSDTVQVHNAIQRIWQGSICLACSADFRTASTAPQDRLVIVQAWSATRIRGKSTGAISPGSFGTLDTLVPEDGHFSPPTLTGYLETENIGIAANVVCWAHLRWNSSTNTSRWELYSSDCPEP